MCLQFLSVWGQFLSCALWVRSDVLQDIPTLWLSTIFTPNIIYPKSVAEAQGVIGPVIGGIGFDSLAKFCWPVCFFAYLPFFAIVLGKNLVGRYFEAMRMPQQF